MTRKFGFTLIELLVVIAIIAILAAIIFPVFMKAKEGAYRSGDMANMNAIRNALQLYRADNGAYPPAILGYATRYASGPNAGQIIPASNLHAALYPKRLDSINTITPAFDKFTQTSTVVAVYPNADPRPLGTAPVKDLNGDGAIDNNDDSDSGARQAYGPNVFYCGDASVAGCVNFGTTSAATAQAARGEFYAVSGYDVAQVTIPPGSGPNSKRWELRYAPRWTSYGVQSGSPNDDPRQLIYNDPPDDTVVTWNSWFRDYSPNGTVSHVKKDIVLFLGGGARAYDSLDLADRAWRVTP